jgi:hypothetical protein
MKTLFCKLKLREIVVTDTCLCDLTCFFFVDSYVILKIITLVRSTVINVKRRKDMATLSFLLFYL